MSEWKKCTIGDMVTLRQGFAINAKSKHYISKEPTSLALLRIADMKSGSREIYVKEDIPINFIAQPQDIVYTRTGNVGLVFRNNYGVVHNNCFTVTPNDARVLSRDFLYYLLQSKYFFEKANSLARGAAQPDLPHSLFNSIEISYPELDCQQRIATILSRYDSLIENYQKQIKLLEEAAQRLYKEWFVDLHFLGHENTKIVDGVPEGWEKKAAQDFFVMSIGKTPPRAEKEWFTTCSTDVPWVSISDMKDVMFVNITSEYLTKEACEKFKVKVVPECTILLSFKLTVGRVSIADIPVCTNEAIAHFRKDGTNWREYTLLYLRDYHYDSLGNTSGISKAVNSTIIKNMPFLMPSKDVLNDFSDKVAPIFNNIKILSSQIRLLTEARDRLLPKLMSGEIAV